MQDPVYEVVTVFRGLLQSPNATVQRDTLQAFYAPDASFDHPFYTVVSGQNSRDVGILPILQYHRCFFRPQVEVHNVGFDKEANKMFIDTTQKLQTTFLPASIYAPKIRYIVVLYLQRGADGRFYIKRQEEYFSPQILIGKFIPGLEPIIVGLKRLAALWCLLFAVFVRFVFRHWRPQASARISNHR